MPRDDGTQYKFPPLDSNHNTKETQWTNTAPIKQSTITGTDTGGKIISTLTMVSNLWREEMSEAMQKNREQIIELHRDHTTAMLALRQTTDVRFNQGIE